MKGKESAREYSKKQESVCGPPFYGNNYLIFPPFSPCVQSWIRYTKKEEEDAIFII
jgi:hypothetical protein